MATWRAELARIVDDEQVAAGVAGLSLRRLHDLRAWPAKHVAAAFACHTAGRSPQHAGPFLEGCLRGGGTDINAALAHCEQQIEHPARTHLILISDLYEGGDAQSMLARIASLKHSGVHVIVLLALSDAGQPGFDANHAQQIAAMNCPVFACTPDQFPALMAAALTNQDIQQWAGTQDIALIRAGSL